MPPEPRNGMHQKIISANFLDNDNNLSLYKMLINSE